MTAPGAPAADAYEEWLRPPLWVWGVGWFLVLSFGVAVLFSAGEVPAVVAVIAPGAAMSIGLIRSTPRVAVQGGELIAGPAHIPVHLLGAPAALDVAAAHHLRGPGADPVAYHLIRPWALGAVRVDVADPADPTPYWYVAMRRPERLAAALRAAQHPPASRSGPG